MREIHVDDIVAKLRQLCIDANIEIRPDTVAAYHRALEQEESETGREVLRQLILNAEAAKAQRIPFCQDTGYAVVFVELGQSVHITGGSFVDALNEGVRQGYLQGFLRKSIVNNPLARINTGDNTPAVVNVDITPGDRLKIRLLIKGAGCDNVSALRMFTQAEGLAAAKDFIVEVADNAGPNASPPFVIGVGMGGPFARQPCWPKRLCYGPWEYPTRIKPWRPLKQNFWCASTALESGLRVSGAPSRLWACTLKPVPLILQAFR